MTTTRPPPTRRRRRTTDRRTTTSTGDDSTEEPDDGTDSEALDVCAELTPEEVGTAIGVDGLTVQQVPGGGCNFFDSEDPVQPSVVFNQVAVDDANGGFDALMGGVTATIQGDTTELDGVGDRAFVVVGTLGGGSALNGGGAVQLGDVGVQVTFLQGIDLPAEDVLQRVSDALALVAGKA